MESMIINTMDLKAASAKVSHSLALQSGATNKAAAAKPAAATAKDASTSSTSDAGDITSTDFLTLLVTEMKNQDPTQPTDPNAYIQQLVGVNSLQQLISINQELGVATGSTASSNSSAVPSSTTASAVAATSAVQNN
jgi:flagellar basal-body rod modification protein FlgD